MSRWDYRDDMSRRGEYTWCRHYFAAHPPSAAVVVDVGALGVESSNSYNLVADDGWRGVLVEPTPGQAQALRESFRGDFTVAEVAVSDEMGRATLWRSRSPGNNSLLKDWNGGRRHPRRGGQTVRVVTLPWLLRDQGVPGRFGLLSVDTEGNDERVLRPLFDSDWRPDVIIVERAPARSPALPFAALLEPEYVLACGMFEDWIWTRKGD